MKTDFNERAKDWDNDTAKVERARRVAAVIRKQVNLRKDMRALEYGCGTGLLSFALQDSLGYISMVDSSPGMLAVLEQKISAAGLSNMTTHLLDLATDPLPDDCYDLIYTLMTLHHVQDSDTVLHRFHELLNAGGALCIADLDQEVGSFHGADFEGHKGFNRQDLKHKLEDLGFTDIRFETATTMQRVVNGQEKEFPVFLCCAEKDS